MARNVKTNQARAMFSLAFGATDDERRPTIGKWLDSTDRKQLEAQKLIELEKHGRTKRAVLTELGWSWVANNFGAIELKSKHPADRMLNRVLGRLQVYLSQQGDTLQAFLDVKPANDQQGPLRRSKPAPARDEALEDRIRRVALQLGNGQVRKRVRLRDVRQRLKDVNRAELDRALFALQDEGGLVLYRIDDPNDVNTEDELAALQVAGFPRHILYLER